MKTPLRWIVVGSLAALTAVAAFGCKDNKKNPMSPGATPNVLITIVARNGSSSFSPNPANVTVGQTVAWKNIATGGMTHTATQIGGGFNTGNISNGSTSGLITIGTAGDLNYECSLHPDMTGTLHVTP
jgi:plastocyanin